jgi:UDP-N-acetyl-2-amino-2-deoxyglucuronate dehydrogenase
MAKALRFAVVGLGFSNRILPAYQAAEETELALLCDIDEAKCRRLSAEYGDVPWTTNFEDCLGKDIDALDVSTPNHLHTPQAVAALEAGKHVLLQKPMAPTVADCARIVESGRKADRAVGLFMSSLANPIIQELRKMLAAGALGQIISMRGRSAHRSIHSADSKALRPADYWRRRKELTGGGSMALIGIHKIHLLQWLCGESIVSAIAESDNLAATDLMSGDDVTAAVCRTEKGTVLVLESSYSSMVDSLEVFGTTGWARLSVGGEMSIALDNPWKGAVAIPGDMQTTSISCDQLEPDKDSAKRKLCSTFCQQSAFARAVLAGEPVPVSGEEGLRDVAVLETIYRAAKSGRRQVPEIPAALQLS